MRRLVILLGLVATVVGAVVVLHTHNHYSACAASTQYGQGFGVTPECQHVMWEELSAVIVLSAGALTATIALLLGRNRRRLDRIHEKRRAVTTSHEPPLPPLGRVARPSESDASTPSGDQSGHWPHLTDDA